MEDTQKLTHMRWIEEQDAQLLEDFFSGENFDGQKAIQFNRLRAEVFMVAPPVFPAVVMALHDCGEDLDTARRAAGEATMRKPAASFEQTLNAATEFLEAWKAA
jgi:hypothetical protein